MPIVHNLTCEYKVDPIGLDEAKPRFSWQISSHLPLQQSAYHLQVFTEDDPKPLWDTGRVLRHDSVLVPYEGPALKGRTLYRWRVRIWDKKNRESEWSDFATFETLGNEGSEIQFARAQLRNETDREIHRFGIERTYFADEFVSPENCFGLSVAGHG